MHFIKTSVVKDLILTAIHKVSTYVMEDEERFTERVRKTTEVQQEESIKEYRRQILKAQKRVKELDGLIKKLYEGNATGKIPDKHFERMLADYDTEQTALENLIFKLQPKVAEYTLESVKVEKFIEIVKKYTDFSELTTPMGSNNKLLGLFLRFCETFPRGFTDHCGQFFSPCRENCIRSCISL